MPFVDRRQFCATTLSLAFVAQAFVAKAGGAPAPAPMRILVWIEDKGPLSFIVDTGASRSALASHAASALGASWQPGEPVRLTTPAGNLDVPTIPVGNMRAGGQPLAIQRLPVLPRLALTTADGLLGADAFVGAMLHLDFRAGRVQLSAAGELADQSPAVPLRREAGGLLVVDATVESRVMVESRVIATLLDTGSLDSVASPALARLDAAREETRLRGADGALLESSPATLPAVAIGETRWPPGPVRRANLAPPPGVSAPPDGAALLLGLDRLTEFDWLAVDYLHGLVQFSPHRGGKE